MRRLLVIGAVLVAATAFVALSAGASGDGGGGYQVRAIFDNAFSLIEGEDVRVSGVNVGKIKTLEVTPDNRAAVVMDITRPGFQDFRADAKCTIRPQSLIGEKFVECSLTEPRPQGERPPPALREIPEGRAGAGQRLLPVERTSKPVDVDLINNITRLPQRQRLAVILNELGAGVAGRERDLNETIRRANPALGATNEVLRLIGEQNQVLRKLAVDSDTVLSPLSRDRERVASFIEQAGVVSQATAERRADLERNFERLPRFLEELRPTMTRLEGFADEFQPVLTDLRAAAPDINRMFRELGPFSRAGIPAVESLGDALVVGRPALLRSKPIIDDLRRLTDDARPLADDLAALTTSLRDSGGIERVMDYLFFQAAAINGFDRFGHYLRAGLIVNTCTQYATDPAPGCSSRYNQSDSSAAQASAASASNIRRTFAAKAGEDHSAEALRGDDGDGERSRTARTGKPRASGGQPAPLRLPSAVLPGEAPARPPAGDRPAVTTTQPSTATQPSGGASPAQEGLLDYLLGDGA
jgi:virulence factor Mce-like protein